VAAQWTDLVDPTREEILHAIAAPLDPDTIEMLAAAPADVRGVRPLLEGHGSYVIAMLSYPRLVPEEDRVEYLEVDLVATPTAVVTIRKSGLQGALAPVDGLQGRADADSTAGSLVHAAVDDVVDAFLELLDGLYEEIDELEGQVEHLRGPAMRRRLAELRHELLYARRTSTATRGAVRRIVDGRVDIGQSKLFPHTVEVMFVDTYETLVRVTEEFDVARDLLAGVRDYYQAKITEGQNEVGKKLTVIASLVLVPSFIVGFYGQNFAGQFREPYWDIGVSTSLIVATTIVQIALFRWRRWI
jgi:magnesium transporter